jgi:hypothetical protein
MAAARLSELAAVYGGTSQGSFTPESLSRDFRELYWSTSSSAAGGRPWPRPTRRAWTG